MKSRLTLIILLTATFASAVFAQAPQEKFANVYGAKIRYVEAGDASKPVVVLLHGLGASADASWPLTIPALAANYRVIAPDLIGFGKSDKPLINYRVAFYVDFLDKFLSEVKADKVSLAGNSMGGWISALYAAKYPAKVEKLILIDAGGYAPPKGFDYAKLSLDMNPSTRDGVRAGLKGLFYNSAMFMSDAVIDNFITARIAANDGYTIQTLIRNVEIADDYFDDEVKALKTPTLIAWGKQDGVTPVSEAERLKKDIAGSELVIFDQAGHFPQIEKAADFNKKILEFLGSK